jgi:D-alanine-D-alanine ligase-like ATP-grasp enzyme
MSKSLKDGMNSMKICVLQSEAANLTHLLPEATEIILQKATIYRQLKALKKQGYDIFVNLCWGLREDEGPSYYEVVKALEDLNLPHTGTSAIRYDTPKSDMKHIAFFAGIDTPAFTVVESLADVQRAIAELTFPMFIKPLAAMDSQGIDERSRVQTANDLITKATELMSEFDQLLIEEYVEGLEYTVLVVGNPDNDCAPILYPPLDRSAEAPCHDEALSLRLQDAARRVFLEMNQGGYATVDLIVDGEGEIFFLEVNAPCAVLGTALGTAPTLVDRIVQPTGKAEFLQQIIVEGVARHQRRQRKYRVGKSAIATYGIFAAQDFKAGDVIVANEARTQRVVSRDYVQSHWADAEHAPLLRYVVSLGAETLVLRDANPADWILENHSCNPNTAYRGLDLVALRDIAAGEEMTVHFAALSGEEMEGFDCMCGAPQCQGAFEFPRCIDAQKSFSLSRLQEALCS